MGIYWNDELATGVSEVDEQHKEIFARVESLLDACKEGRGKEKVKELLLFLEDYVVEHFSAEERMMSREGYPDIDAHKAVHASFLKEVSDLNARFEQDGPSLSVVMNMNRLCVDWLVNHISKTDREVGDYIKGKG
ncbi:MAG TPA: bacteriohemerythrin [Nitrospirota bacterium]